MAQIKSVAGKNPVARKVGLGLRRDHYRGIFADRPSVPWFEAITENFAGRGGMPRANLARIRRDYPLVLHGVSLSIGSYEPISPAFLRDWKELIGELDPLWVSDHLCWTRHAHENSFDLLPLQLTRASLTRVAERVDYVQSYLGRAILLENPSAYVEFAANEMGEADFLAELARRTGCGLLVDLNNIVVTKHNLGADPAAYLEKLRGTWVPQLHLAGHMLADGVRIDTHDHPVSDEVKALLPRALAIWPEAAPMLEWDDKIPPLAELLRHRQELQDIVDAADPVRESASAPRAREGHRISSKLPQREEDLHLDFWKIVKNPQGLRAERDLPADLLRNDLPTQALVGARVYNNAYFLRLRDTLKSLYPALAFATDDGFDEIIADYLTHTRPGAHSIDDAGGALPGFLAEHSSDHRFGTAPGLLASLAAFENARLAVQLARDEAEHGGFAAECLADPEAWSSIGVSLASTARLVSLEFPVEAAWENAVRGEAPEIPERAPALYLVSRAEDFSVTTERLDGFAGRVADSLMSSLSLYAAAERACSACELAPEEFLPRFAPLVGRWLASGIFVPRAVALE